MCMQTTRDINDEYLIMSMISRHGIKIVSVSFGYFCANYHYGLGQVRIILGARANKRDESGIRDTGDGLIVNPQSFFSKLTCVGGITENKSNSVFVHSPDLSWTKFIFNEICLEEMFSLAWSLYVWLQMEIPFSFYLCVWWFEIVLVRLEHISVLVVRLASLQCSHLLYHVPLPIL